MNTRNIVAIILAAGGASRMGQAKQLLQYRGKTLLEWAIDRTLSLDLPIVVVLGAAFDRISPAIDDSKVHIAVNKNWASGISTSIQTGIEFASNTVPDLEGVILILADQPGITSKHLMSLLNQGITKNKIVATEYATAPGVPAYFPQAYFSNLMRLTGDQGAKSLLIQSAEQLIRIPLEAAALDIDTKEDWTNFLRDNSGN